MKKLVVYAVALFLLVSIVYGVVSHQASQIEPGDFPAGAYTFDGKVNVTAGNDFCVEGGSCLSQAQTGSANWNVSGSDMYPTDLAYEVGIGIATPTEALHVAGNINVTSGNDICIEAGNCLSAAGSGSVGGTGVADRVALWTAANTLSYDNSFVWDNTNDKLGLGVMAGLPTEVLHVSGNINVTAGNRICIEGGNCLYGASGNIGIGDTTPQSTLTVHASGAPNVDISSAAISGIGTTYGVFGRVNDATNGNVAVLGTAGGSSGLVRGVQGNAISTSAGSAGVYGHHTSASGVVYGVHGDTQSTTTGAAGVMGNTSAATGAVNGVYGITKSTSGRGVYGQATASTGVTNGVYGISSSSSGRGVFGQGDIGVYGFSNFAGGAGVMGYNSVNNAGSYGIQGLATGAGRAGYFSGGYGLRIAAANFERSSVGNLFACTSDNSPSGEFGNRCDWVCTYRGLTCVSTVDVAGSGDRSQWVGSGGCTSTCSNGGAAGGILFCLCG